MHVLLVATLIVAPLAAQDAVTQEARDAALVRAFRYLDNNLLKLEEVGSPRRQYTMAVAGYAYLLAAERHGKKLPGRSRQLKRIRAELVRYVEKVEGLYEKDAKKKRRSGARRGGPGPRTAQYTWTLGVAAHFFAESVARKKSIAESKSALKAILKVLAASQQSNGGWGHDDASRPGMGMPPVTVPKPGGGRQEYPHTLHAASYLALSGMGVAQRALRQKPDDAIAKAREFFAQSQNGGGTWPYDATQTHKTSPVMGHIEVARTSGVVFALFCAGAAGDDPIALEGLAAIDKRPEFMSEGHGSAAMALQFGALLARARGESAWQVFRRTFFGKILAAQEESGAFLCVCSDAFGVTNDIRPLPGMPPPRTGSWVEQGKTYVTAIHALILLLDRTPPRGLPDMPGPRGPTTPSGQ